MESYSADYKKSEEADQKRVSYAYELTFKNQVYRGTGYDVPVKIGENEFTPMAISHSESDDAEKIFTIALTLENGFLRQFFLTNPVFKLYVKIYRINGNLPNPSPEDIFLILNGEVTGVTFKKAVISLTTIPLAVGLDTKIPNCFYSKFCNWRLFGTTTCKLAKENYTTTATITEINIPTKTIVVDATETSTNFCGLGQLVYDSVSYPILKSNVSTIILADIPSAHVGDSVTLIAGCDKTVNTCKNKFNNMINFGGHIVPPKNPSIDGI